MIRPTMKTHIRTHIFPVTALAVLLVIAVPSTLQAQSTDWLGTASTDWWDGSNWNNGVPDSTTETLVSYGSPSRFDLYVPAPENSDTARVGDLTIQHSGRMVFASSPSPGLLVVHGSVLSLNGGELILGDGTILFKSDVQINRGGDINAGDGTLEFQGNVIAQSGAIFTPGTSTVVFSGDSDQTVSGDFEFSTVIVETQGILNLTGNINVTGSVTIVSGSVLLIDSGSTFACEGEIGGDGEYVDNTTIQTTSVLSDANPSLPLRTGVQAVYPNPFNPTTRVSYFVEHPGRIRLAVYDLVGREVSVLFDGHSARGHHSYVWDAGALPSGTYICRLSSERTSTVRRMTLIR